MMGNQDMDLNDQRNQMLSRNLSEAKQMLSTYVFSRYSANDQKLIRQS